MSKNQVILTNSSRDITIFVSPCFSDLVSYKHLQQCLCLLHQLQHLLHLNLSFIKPPSMCHSPHMTGMHLTRCVSLDCSSASLILGFSFARSRLRNAWTTYSASWARKVMQLWTIGSQLMKPTNEIWRNSLIILRAPWMMRSPPEFRVYELEDIKKRSDESINELIDRIHQLTHHVQIGNGSDAAIEFEVQCRLIQAIPDADIKLWKELLKLSHEKKVSHLLEISHTYYAIESGAAAMCAGKAIHALCQGCQPQKNKPQKSTSQCPNCTHSHPPGHDNCPVWNAICKGCSKKVTGMQSAAALVLLANNPLKSDGAEKAPHC